MTIQHKNIADADLHEPKGVAAATSGKVYTSDGSGSGVWEYPPAKAHAEIYIAGGVTAHTLASSSNYSLLNPSGEWTASGFEDILTVTPSTGTIVLNQTGHYFIDFWCNFDTVSLAANKQYSFKFAIDGVVSPRVVSVQKHTSGIDRLHIAAAGLVSATANQTLSIYVAGDATTSGTNITVVEAGLTALFLD